ncbi:DUF5719 family protein [Cellulomonas composti]|uniref:Secreted protein n=1 Tax=Cellulomonas composti TaxID=266130 RepID=A0A511JAY7_9CELL|nr:DUF5719 family protein [Cellulomonas composti]GEL95152.1 hypothetical protein CCO02nite_18100 [Cellulomonas composti]
MSARTRAVRIVSGIGVVALLGAVVVGAGRLPTVEESAAAPGTAVTVPPAPALLVCPGPLVLPEDRGGDDAFDPTPVDPVTGVQVVAADSGGGTVTTIDGSDTLGALQGGTQARTFDDVTDPLLVRADPSDDGPALVAAAGGGLVTAGDLRGLAAASCQPPTTDAWLVGGATDLGTTTVLVLQNPGSTPATVHLEVFGATGPVDLSTVQYLVAPGTQRVVVLGGTAPQERRVAVHLTATGGRVAAFLQSSTLDGFTPTGTDLVVPGSPAATRQVVPAVTLRETDVDDPDAGVLRVLSPDVATTARVRVLGPDGVRDLPGAADLELPAGTVVDVPLGGLPAGQYTFVVDAADPVVAGAMLARPGDPTALDPDVPTRETAWVASVSGTETGLLALPTGTVGLLTLGAVASGDALDASGGLRATLRVIATDGTVAAEKSVDVPLGTTLTQELAELAPDTDVAGVEIVTTDDERGRLAIGLVARVGQPDGTMLSVLTPVVGPDSGDGLVVRPDVRLGLS